jgi:hypothetical protein
MLNSIRGDESSFSRDSFPSLKLMHSREDENIIDEATTISGEVDSIFTDTYNLIDASGMVHHADIIQKFSYCSDDESFHGDPAQDCCTLDGYPTDERTVQDFYQSKGKERLRLNILQVAHKNLATKYTTEILGDEKDIDDSYLDAMDDAEHIKKGHALTFDGDPTDDDSSFFATIEVEDEETKQHPAYSNQEQYVFGFSFITTKNGEIVEEEPDDSSFIVGAGVDDVPDDFLSIGQSRAGTAADSLYDVHASTLSRASAPDKTLAGSNMRNNLGIKWSWDSNTADKLQVDEDQSASAYSHGRAYVDIDHASTLSALTGETLFFALRTGMSEAIMKSSPLQEDPSFESGETSEKSKPSRDGEIKRFQSAPVDADTGALFLHCDKSLEFGSGEPGENSKPSRGGEIKKIQSAPVDADTGALFFQCDKSLEESLPRPPPLYHSDQATDFVTYENPDHLKMMLSYGEGGFVDEEAARIFSGSDRPNGANRNSCWLTSSSRTVKLCVMFSVILTIISVTSLALAFLLPEQLIFTGRDEHVQHSGHIDVEASASTNSSKLEAGTVTYLDDCGSGVMCSIEGSRCTDGTTESCCGEAFYSFFCDCANVDGMLIYNACIFTDACLAPTCDNFEAPLSPNYISAIASSNTPSAFPSYGPSNGPTQLPSTDVSIAIILCQIFFRLIQCRYNINIYLSSATSIQPTPSPSKSPAI